MPRGHKWTDEERAKSIATRKANALKRKAQREAREAELKARELKRQESIRDHAVLPQNKTPIKMRTNVHEPPTLDEQPGPPECWNCGREATMIVEFNRGKLDHSIIPACDGPSCRLHSPDQKVEAVAVDPDTITISADEDCDTVLVLGASPRANLNWDIFESDDDV